MGRLPAWIRELPRLLQLLLAPVLLTWTAFAIGLSAVGWAWNRLPKPFVRTARAVLGVATLVAFLGIVLWRLPQEQTTAARDAALLTQIPEKDRLQLEKDLILAETAARTTLAQIVGGGFLLVGLYLAWKRMEMTQDRQITDRFIRSVEHLGSERKGGEPNIEIRLGAVYALRRVAEDSPKDAPSIVEILSAYVRENSSTQAMESDRSGRRRATNDLVAAVEAASLSNARLRARGVLDLTGTDLRAIPLSGLNLSRACLDLVNLAGARIKVLLMTDSQARSANFTGARIAGAVLDRSDFVDADFSKADLSHVNARSANLQRADLSSANFSHGALASADFSGVEGRNAILRFADLTGAKFGSAPIAEDSIELRHTNLRGADLSGALLHDARLANADLREANLEGADLTGATLDSADLSGASLKGANLTGASLRGTLMAGCMIDGARFDLRVDPARLVAKAPPSSEDDLFEGLDTSDGPGSLAVAGAPTPMSIPPQVGKVDTGPVNA